MKTSTTLFAIFAGLAAARPALHNQKIDADLEAAGNNFGITESSGGSATTSGSEDHTTDPNTKKWALEEDRRPVDPKQPIDDYIPKTTFSWNSKTNPQPDRPRTQQEIDDYEDVNDLVDGRPLHEHNRVSKPRPQED
ncbi:hypothetical protein HRG_006238 [Hirsutella rhossiliensis]|uniref:Uncharacterized protein n=1 Tax=Hirsutella rhossiliensis TaxID=111463 RepID=A0A9P8MWS8_9HYPO|nr:uncharacterized protein HRG_06238 [Hirsutella rhossiliensis]KAH0963728.1 hypothetical protein HRG_06238 [Hirsutella rhossiliensis]